MTAWTTVTEVFIHMCVMAGTNNQEAMGHIAHLRNISKHLTNLSKPMIIKAVWFKALEKGAFHPRSFAEIVPVVLKRRLKCEKCTDIQMDDRQDLTRKAQLSFQLRWARNCWLTTLFSRFRILLGSLNKHLHLQLVILVIWLNFYYAWKKHNNIKSTVSVQYIHVPGT